MGRTRDKILAGVLVGILIGVIMATLIPRHPNLPRPEFVEVPIVAERVTIYLVVTPSVPPSQDTSRSACPSTELRQFVEELYDYARRTERSAIAVEQLMRTGQRDEQWQEDMMDALDQWEEHNSKLISWPIRAVAGTHEGHTIFIAYQAAGKMRREAITAMRFGVQENDANMMGQAYRLLDTAVALHQEADNVARELCP